MPQPDIASCLRRLPSAPGRTSTRLLDETAPVVAEYNDVAAQDARVEKEGLSTTAASEERPHAPEAAPAARAVVAPLASDRYLLRITLSAEARARLERARDLLRHVVPTGDPALIVDRALRVLVEQLERSRCAAAHRPRTRHGVTTTSRHVPASVRRAVWARDEGRCAFIGAAGRCRETGRLELHHVVPFARGGPTSAENLQLRCRAHNAYEAEHEFGARVSVRSARVPHTATLSGQSPIGDVVGERLGSRRGAPNDLRD